MSQQDVWQESPRMQRFEFKTKGDTLIGKLLEIEPVEVEGEMKNQIIVETMTENGKAPVSFLEMADMRRRITREQIGSAIRIVYQGDSDTVGANKGNAMKLFSIAFKRIPTSRPQPSHQDAGGIPEHVTAG